MRPYYHYDDRPTGGYRFSFGSRMTHTVKVLIAVNAVVHFFLWVTEGQLAEPHRWLGFYIPYFLRGALWQPVTYMFVHANFWHLLFNMVGLYFFGGTVERQMGRKKFLWMYFLCGVAGALLSLFQLATEAAVLPVVGASGGVLGVLVAFATLFPDARIILFPIFIPIRARYIAIFYCFVTVWSLARGAGPGIAHWAHLGGMAVGFLFIKGQPLGGKLSRLWEARRRLMREQRTAAEQAELDRILEKVHREGITSLSNQERDFLNLMSKKYQDRN